MKKTTCFILGSLVGGGIAGCIGLVSGTVVPFLVADKCENHCIAWRMNRNGHTSLNFYGNKELFPELNEEETSDE